MLSPNQRYVVYALLTRPPVLNSSLTFSSRQISHSCNIRFHSKSLAYFNVNELVMKKPSLRFTYSKIEFFKSGRKGNTKSAHLPNSFPLFLTFNRFLCQHRRSLFCQTDPKILYPASSRLHPLFSKAGAKVKRVLIFQSIGLKFYLKKTPSS